MTYHMNNKLNDSMNLQTFKFDADAVYTEADVIRSLKGENSRLLKLSQEKDLEIRRLKKDADKKNIPSGKMDLGEGAAAMRIIELSKLLREKTAEIEVVRTRLNEQLRLNSKLWPGQQPEHQQADEEPNKQQRELTNLRERLRHREHSLAEARTRLDKTSRDLQAAERLLRQEIGGDISSGSLDVRQMLQQPTPGWRGRAQKIAALSAQVDKLKIELQTASNGDRCGSGASSLGWRSESHSLSTLTGIGAEAEARQKQRRERQRDRQNLEKELTQLRLDKEKLHRQSEGNKARNVTLSSDVNRLKKQIKEMLEKAENDDELVTGLLRRQEQLRFALENATAAPTSAIPADQTRCIVSADEVERLRELLHQRDSKIRALESATSETVTINAETISEEEKGLGEEEWRARVLSLELETVTLRQLTDKAETRTQQTVSRNLAIMEENASLKLELLHVERDLKRDLERVVPGKAQRARLQKQMTDRAEDADDPMLDAEAPLTRQTVSGLQAALVLAGDRLVGVEAALQAVQTARTEDQVLLTAVLEQTRLQFVQCVRRLRQGAMVSLPAQAASSTAGVTSEKPP